jgi:NhaP-type Na+/H+ or K+/H+ antiporter
MRIHFDRGSAGCDPGETLNRLAICSAGLAVVALLVPFLFKEGHGLGVAAFRRAGRSAARLLLGVLPALYWPVICLLVTLICRFGDDCL